MLFCDFKVERPKGANVTPCRESPEFEARLEYNREKAKYISYSLYISTQRFSSDIVKLPTYKKLFCGRQDRGFVGDA